MNSITLHLDRHAASLGFKPDAIQKVHIAKIPATNNKFDMFVEVYDDAVREVQAPGSTVKIRTAKQEEAQEMLKQLYGGGGGETKNETPDQENIEAQ